MYQVEVKARSEEFQKLQVNSGKQLEDLQKNFQEQQDQRHTEMECYKKGIIVLYEKTMEYAIMIGQLPLKFIWKL